MSVRLPHGRTAAAVLSAALALAVLLVPARPATAEVTAHCGRYETVPVAGGRYVVDNNDYGDGVAQCLATDGGADYTVTSSNAAVSPPAAPVAFPEIFEGCHWGTCSSGSALPLQVAQLGSVTSGWSAALPAQGDFDMAYDLWFNTTPSTAGQPDAAELMVWLARQPAAESPSGTTANVGGASWTTWQLTISANGRQWPMIAYNAAVPTTSVSGFDLRAFVRDAVVRGVIRPEWYLISVEAGFETWSGGAGLRTDSYSSAAQQGYPTGPVTAGAGGLCLAAQPNGTPDGPEPVALLTCDGSAAQQWSVAVDGTITHSGKCLGTNGDQAALDPCNGSAYHVWLAGLGGALWNQGAAACLRDPSSGSVVGGGADLAGCDGSTGQRWTLPTAVSATPA